ncbi:MAG: hypothetical protein D3907_02900 [Candidatus Electrothrix sp. AUS3]|nr:hypothetical protein [Candidatus Electrothrix gigas]
MYFSRQLIFSILLCFVLLVPHNAMSAGCEPPLSAGFPGSTSDPGMCWKCENYTEVPDDSEDPGICKKCSGGNVVNDDSENPGLCQKCKNGDAVADDDEGTQDDCTECIHGQVTDKNCTGKWSNFRVFAEYGGDWWFEWGTGSVSWYGIGAVKVCANVNIGARGSITCKCCPISNVSGVVKVGPVTKVCLELEVPWTTAIALAALAGVPIPGTRIIAVGAIGAFGIRASQRLYRTYERLNEVITAKEAFENLVNNDTIFPTGFVIKR